ncbi:MAG: hypothetical protein EXR36_06320 [Betaproteobacteria bacterium]|nr:hypothetical protein [Betaproteobacteria bacterium]
MLTMLEWARDTLNRSIAGRSFILVVSPHGELLAVRGMEAIMDQYRSEMSRRVVPFDVRARQDAMIESFFGEDTIGKTMTLSLLLPYPARPVRPGDSWSDRHEFEIAGLKMTLSRTLALDAEPGEDGQVSLSGSVEMVPRKEGWVIDSRQASWSMRSQVDAATGMYSTLEAEGHIDLTARERGVPADAPPLLEMDLRTTSSATVTRLARRDPNDKRLWVFHGGFGAYRLRLGSEWTTGAMDEQIAGMLFSVYRHARSDAQLTATVRLPSLEYEREYPLKDSAARMMAIFSGDARRPVKLSWSKLFSAGPVRWVRFRVEVPGHNGGPQRTYWAQLGYGAHRYYSFELMSPGAPSQEMDAEISEILDSITTTEAASQR